jgi:hypothetical protein
MEDSTRLGIAICSSSRSSLGEQKDQRQANEFFKLGDAFFYNISSLLIEYL